MFTMWTHRFDLIVYEVLKSRNKRDELKDETCKMQKNIYIYIYHQKIIFHDKRVIFHYEFFYGKK